MTKTNKPIYEKTVHTKISFYSILIAIVVQTYLFIRHTDERFGQVAGFEALFAFIGLIGVDLIRNRKLTFFNKNLQKPSKNLLTRTLIILSVIAIIQVVFKFIPLTIKDYEMALAIVFAAPAEEIFFRALFLEPFIKLGKNSERIQITKKRSITYVEIIGIIMSGVFFAIFHINYYGNINLMLIVLIGGIWLGFMYIFYRDITALILAHFMLNLMVVGQQFFLIGGLG